MKETKGNLHRNSNCSKLEHENWTGPRRMANVIQQGSSLEVIMEGREVRRSRLVTSAV